MHRVDANSHVGNMFDEGDPAIPRLPTQIDKHILNAMMMELCNAVTGSGQTLVKGTWDQLEKAIGLAGGSGGARAFAASLAGEFFNLVNTGLGAVLKLAGSGTSEAVLDLTQNSTGPLVKGAGNAGGDLCHIENFGNGVTLRLTGKDGKSPLNLTPRPTLPIAGMAAGDVVFLSGVYNKLYVYDGTTWNACW